jgi:serine/threonine-protein phosphatase 6 regulatory subunit 3
MSFWRNFGFYTVSSIETTLNKPDFTLEDLLDDEEILQEVKAQNKKLIDVLAQPANLKKLVDYLTTEPAEDTQKQQFKLPLISAEVLCSDVPAILEGLMKDAALVEQLLSYLEQPAPLHSVRSNLVCRVIGFFLDKRPTETLATMQAKGNLMDRFLEHLDNASVVELLQKVVGSEPSSEAAEAAHFQWLQESQLINKLTCKLDPKLDSDTHLNAAGALVDMSRVPAMAKALESEDILKTLLQYVLTNSTPKPLASNSAMISGLTVIIELLRHNPALKFEPVSDLPLDKLPIVYTIILKELDKFKAILAINSSNETIPTTMGDIEPLGFARLKVLELVSVLSQSNYECVDKVLMEKDIFVLVLDLFFHFRWNNVLHAHVLNMLRRGLEGANEDIKEHLLKHARLPSRIVEAERENATALQDPRGVRRGYMGHLVQLATDLKKQATHSKVIEAILDADEDWKVFRDGFLKSRNDLESHLLGGRATQMDSSSSAEEEDDDDDQDDDDDDIERNFIDATPDDADFNPDGPFDEQPHGSASSDEDSEEEEDPADGEAPPQAPEEKA